MTSPQIELKLLSKIRSKSNVDSIKISPDTNLSSLKDEIRRVTEARISKNRLGLFLDKNGESTPLISIRRSLTQMNVQNGDKIIVKDLGPQIDWRLVYVLEYLGPIFIFTFFFWKLGWDNSNLTQKLAYFMGVCHFIKRVLESIFIHIFSRSTMPLKNLAINCTYYWLIFGVSVGYSLFNIGYEEPTYIPVLRYFFFSMFICAEIKNLKCHLILRDLRNNDPESRGIPLGEGFEFVSAANYFWEIMAWMTFSLFVNHWSSYLFTCCGFYILRLWSLKKHKDYLKTFGDKYPKNRKAFIPFLI